MSLEPTQTVSGTPPVMHQRTHKHVYPLRMETIPISEPDSKAALQSNEPTQEDEVEAQYFEGKQSVTNLSPDLKFKRHKNKHVQGFPTLGERLDNLQDIKKAKRVENFNSSAPIGDANHIEDASRNAIADVNTGAMPAPYMPYYYYYQPMNAPTPGMMPYLGSPMHSMMPNSSLQPFYSQQATIGGPDMTTPQNLSSSQHLLPAPQLFPYGTFHQRQQQPHYIQRTRERKKSIGTQRGRRLSMLASQGNGGSTIISPHKDIPEEDFYTVVGNASFFGKNLQMRQLFNWCLIRSLHKLELKAKSREEEAELNHQTKKSKLEPAKTETDYVDPKRLAMVIIKEFVDDLKKDHIAIDWEDEEKDQEEDGEKGLDNTESYDDTELRQLFQENDDDDDDNEMDYSEIQRSRHKFKERRKAMSNVPKKLLPNGKNVENTKNLSLLMGKVNAIKNEVKEWATTLDTSRPDLEWQELTSLSPQPQELGLDTEETDLSFTDIEAKLKTKVDDLRYQSHILNSHSLALNEITNSKLNKLNIETMRKISDETDDNHSQVINSQQLLKGLSLSFSKKLDV
ncbi:dsn1p [Saccharomyces arboricola H-6]|uniref:Dsn1p n=1 Tax=Saccharomyces arboricola (strain H-6 / AS 2.3317 / CBS 10644) TaxID=1160507 RepID=J8LMF1_SACAR|nr:dsn1p [Saccharomyces arboricola H-6]